MGKFDEKDNLNSEEFDDENPDEIDDSQKNSPFHAVPMGAMFIRGPAANLDPRNLFSMFMGGGDIRQMEEFYLLGKTWVLRIVDRIENEETGFGTFYMELFPNIQVMSRSSVKLDALDMYELVTKTQFMNFIVTLLGNYRIYNMEDIQCFVHEDEVKKFVGLKIIIPLIRKGQPKWIHDVGVNYQADSHSEIRDINGIPVMVYQRKNRHFCAPLIIYDLVASIPSNSQKNFNSSELDVGNCYVKFIVPLLRDAIYDFYGVSPATEYLLDNTSKLRVMLDAHSEPNLFRIRVVCTPGVIGGEGNSNIYHYEYLGNMTHAISTTPVAKVEEENSVDINTMIDRCLAQFVHSDCSQLFVKSLEFLGNCFTENHLNCMQKAEPLLFNCDMSIADPEPWVNDGNVRCAVILSEKYSHLVQNYWVVRDGPVSIDFDNGAYLFYGIINVNIDGGVKEGINSNDELLDFLLKNDGLAAKFNIQDLPKGTFFKPAKDHGLALCDCCIIDRIARFLLVRQVKN